MNLKKILSNTIIASIMLAIILAIIPTKVNAETINLPSKLYLGLVAKRDGEEIGYAIDNPNNATNPGAKLWKIIEYTGTESSDDIKTNGLKDIYCVKEGFGFSPVTKKVEYNVSLNMKTKRSDIAAKSDILNELVSGKTITSGETTINTYNALLALGDLLYISGDTAEQRTAYLEAAGICENTSWSKMITDSDIEAVQQAAVWYFTNYGDTAKDYDKTGKTGWLNYTLDENTYNSLSNYKNTAELQNEGRQRQEQAEILYNYLITTAKANAVNYTDSNVLVAPATQNTESLNYVEEGANYKVGPIRITENAGNVISYTIDLIVKTNGTATTSYKIKDSSGNEVAKTNLKELARNGQDFYVEVEKEGVTSISVYPQIKYTKTTLTLWTSETGANTEQPVMIPVKTLETDGEELVVTPNTKIFDLALRKYITKIGTTVLAEINKTRVPNIDTNSLKNEGTTATYKHRKDPLTVKTGDLVTYELTIYNEGQKAGRALEIIDQLPAGLEFERVVSGNFEADKNNEEDYNKTTNTLKLKRKASNEENLDAYAGGTTLDSETIEIECTVTATPNKTSSKVLTNVAWISKEYDSESNITIINQTNADRDSEPGTTPSVNKDNMSDYTGNGNKSDLSDKDYYYKGQQDDDDFEKLIMLPEAFDLKLIKNIVEVNEEPVTERLEEIDVSKLNTLVNGEIVKTADYQMNKNPVSVSKGDIVTYRLRVYNEGTIDGYAAEISEDIPEGLEFIWSEKQGEALANDTELTEEEKEAVEFNQEYLWGNFKYDENREKIVQISTDYLSKENEATEGSNLIKAFGNNDGTKTKDDLYSKEVFVKMKVVSDDVTGATIRNEAAITEDTDLTGTPVDDRDSDTEDWKEHPDHEDDEDHDYIILKSFDLALRKFIIAVSRDENIEESEYLKTGDKYTRAPEVDTSKLNTTGEDGKKITTAIYNHTKEPVQLTKNDYVIYMLRVYNEGDIDGYAAEIKDHLPSYLKFVDGEFNEQYGWEASEDGRTVTTEYLKNSKIKKAVKNNEGGYTLWYQEVPIMCQVTDKAVSNEKITNIADITKYLDENKKPAKDRDSKENDVVLPDDSDLPEYDNGHIGEYYPGQYDDDDFEKVIVREFDLALRKWVTQAIVTDSTGTTVTNTGHQPYDDPEQVVKVELKKKNINKVTVKFKYSIRVINEGDIEGYAKEITDYVPQGLKFVAADNPGWTDEGNNVISTRLLENTLLQPGEYADVEVILTWINNSNNMGVKTNIAEISEDNNPWGVPDRDSTPDNKEPGEDDIDDAPVMLMAATGKAQTYVVLGLTVLVIIAGGVTLIKKYVL